MDTTKLSNASAFRYRIVREYEISNLVNRKMWMTNPHYFNDPYDCSLSFSSDVLVEMYMIRQIAERYSGKMPMEQCMEFARMLWASIKDDLGDEMKDRLVKLGLSLDKYVAKTAIACFSLEILSIYMWSMYSDVHQGFCLEYGFRDLLAMGGFGRVSYSESATELYGSLIEDNEVKRLMNQYVLTKHKSWSHESEWRLVQVFEDIKDDARGILIDSPLIKGIYLGCKITAEHKKRLLEIAEQQKIPAYQMTMKSDAFELIHKRVNGM